MAQDQENQNSSPNLYTHNWGDKDAVETLKPIQKSHDKENHKFKYGKKANEAQCECGVGYMLSAGMEIWADGHIYYEGSLII